MLGHSSPERKVQTTDRLWKAIRGDGYEDHCWSSTSSLSADDARRYLRGSSRGGRGREGHNIRDIMGDFYDPVDDC